MGYLQSEPNLLDWLLKHLDTSAVCDFLHKLVMNVEGPDMRSSLYEVSGSAYFILLELRIFHNFEIVYFCV